MQRRLSIIMLAFLGPTAFAAGPPDAPALRERIQAVIEYVDSEAYAQAVPWDTCVLTLFELAAERPPTPWEMRAVAGMRDDIGFKRSDVLALALSTDAAMDWDRLRNFLARFDQKDLQPAPEQQKAAQALSMKAAGVDLFRDAPSAQEPALEPLPPLPKQIPNEPYNTYFGYLHAHCQLSDGVGTPLEAYEFARDEGGLDFFSLTDHGEFLMLWPWQNRWQQLRDAAEATYAPGEYVSLWGFEWSNFLLGHINVINSPDFTDMIRTFRISELYRWIAARPDSFAIFNHPGRFDMFKREAAAIYDDVIPQFVGMEIWNTNSGFEEYFYGRRWGCRADTYFDSANKLGWRIGALGAQDNHDRAWGTMNDFRTGVLATELTREAILDAYRQRRFYATEDKDLLLDFRSSGYPMGAVLEEDAPRQFTITARDDSGDRFTSVRLYREGRVIAERQVDANSLSINFTDPGNASLTYYYAVVTQSDDNDGDGRGDEAVSSPIWFGEYQARWGCAAFRGDWWTHPLGLTSGDSAIFAGLGVILLLTRRRMLRRC